MVDQGLPRDPDVVSGCRERALQAAREAADKDSAGPLHLDVQDKADLIKAISHITRCLLGHHIFVVKVILMSEEEPGKVQVTSVGLVQFSAGNRLDDRLFAALTSLAGGGAQGQWYATEALAKRCEQVAPVNHVIEFCKLLAWTPILQATHARCEANGLRSTRR